MTSTLHRTLLSLCLLAITPVAVASIPRRPCDNVKKYVKVLAGLALLQAAKDYNRYQETVTLTMADIRDVITDASFLELTSFLWLVADRPLPVAKIVIALETSAHEYASNQALVWGARLPWQNDDHKRMILTTLCKGRPLALTELQEQLNAIYGKQGHPKSRL